MKKEERKAFNALEEASEPSAVTPLLRAQLEELEADNARLRKEVETLRSGLATCPGDYHVKQQRASYDRMRGKS